MEVLQLDATSIIYSIMQQTVLSYAVDVSNPYK
jgi:hypothetical protein